MFLCGGEQGAGKTPLPSVREALLRHLPNREKFGESRILLAEQAVDAFADTAFENLLDLEECIAAIVTSVVLIVESAGSICELGAFCKTPEIRKKLVVIVQNEKSNIKSFIVLGALNYIKSQNQEQDILPYDWSYGNDNAPTVAEYALNAMTSDVPEAIGRINKTEIFDKESKGHIIYLILAICHILRGAKIGEIKKLLDVSGILIEEKLIRKYLDTLEICKFVKTVAVGKKRTHYVSLVERIPISVSFRDGVEDKSRNILRRIQEIVLLVHEEDPTRIEIFQEHNHAA
jgi:hypothetical protein